MKKPKTIPWKTGLSVRFMLLYVKNGKIGVAVEEEEEVFETEFPFLYELAKKGILEINQTFNITCIDLEKQRFKLQF